MNTLKLMFLSLVVLIGMSCKKEPVTPIEEGNDPNFKIVANEDGILKDYNRKVVVFGIDILCSARCNG